MKKLIFLIKKLIRYEKQLEEVTGHDLDKLIADRVKKELNEQ
jgi:hypothetical protein